MEDKNQIQGWSFLFSDDWECDNLESGSEGYKYSDSSGFYRNSNGTDAYKYSDGSGYFKGADGSEGYRYSDGSGYYRGADGSEGRIYSDGSGYYRGADGTDLTYNDFKSDTDGNSKRIADAVELGTVSLGLLAAYAVKKSEEREDDRIDMELLILKGIGVLFAALILGLVVYWIHGMIIEAIAVSKGQVNAGSYSELVGEDYRDVVSHFQNAGFTNISTKDLDDAGILFWRNEDVAEISVDGNTEFGGREWFEPDVEVIISYH